MGRFVSLKSKMRGHRERSSNPSIGRVGSRSYYPPGHKKRGTFGNKTLGINVNG